MRSFNDDHILGDFPYILFMDYETFLHWDMATLEVIFIIYVRTRYWDIPIDSCHSRLS